MSEGKELDDYGDPEPEETNEAGWYNAKLPAEIAEQIAAGMRRGVTFSLERRRRPAGHEWEGLRRHRITGIHWRPGDPNALAAAIIKHVHERPMPLELDGRRYLIMTEEDVPREEET